MAPSRSGLERGTGPKHHLQTGPSGLDNGDHFIRTHGVDLPPYLLAKRSGLPHDGLFRRGHTMSDNDGARRSDWKFVHLTEGDASPCPNQRPACAMLFNLAEQPDLATERSAKRTELRTLSEAWSTEVDTDRRKLGIVWKMPQSLTPAKAKATSVR